MIKVEDEEIAYICNKKDMLLYAVTNSSWTNEKDTLLIQIENALKGGVTFVQLREKNMELFELIELGKKVKILCDRYEVPFVIDDNIEAAMLCGADGVHIGQNDMKTLQARELLGKDKIVGVTAKTVKQALIAQKEGASYIGTGAAFSTTTKRDTYVIPHSDIKEIVQAVNIPVIAIGGINEENVLQLKDTGIDGVAVVAAIFASKNITEDTKKLLNRIEEMRGND